MYIIDLTFEHATCCVDTSVRRPAALLQQAVDPNPGQARFFVMNDVTDLFQIQELSFTWQYTIVGACTL